MKDFSPGRFFTTDLALAIHCRANPPQRPGFRWERRTGLGVAMQGRRRGEVRDSGPELFSRLFPGWPDTQPISASYTSFPQKRIPSIQPGATGSNGKMTSSQSDIPKVSIWSAIYFTSCVTLGSWLNLSKPQNSSQRRDHNMTFFVRGTQIIKCKNACFFSGP